MPPGSAENDSLRSASMPQRTGIALLIVLAVFAVGRFVPGVGTWGFSHLAYLPAWIFGLWLAGAGILVWPRASRWIAGILSGRASSFLLESKFAYPAVACASGLLFAVLGRHTHFLGDGTWLSASVASGQQFHFFDFVDYRIHVLAYQALAGRVPADVLYRVGSVGAGIVASVVHLALVRRLSWERWRRTLAYLVLFCVPPVVLYFGYVESYSFLFVALTAFFVAGILVCQERLPLWVASAFYGVGLLLHLSALFSLPALLYLGWVAPRRSLGNRLLQTLAPPLLGILLGVLLYIISGYDLARFQREFLHSEQGRSILLPLTGERGAVSVLHGKDLLNLVLLTAPACLVVCLFETRRIARCFRLLRRTRSAGSREDLAPAEEAPGDILATSFLVIQIASVALVRLLVDAKLGGAKDWDLVAAQSAGLPLLATLVLGGSTLQRAGVASAGIGEEKARLDAPSSPGGLIAPSEERAPTLAGLVLGVCWLTTVPWIVLQSFEDRSIARLIEVTADAPPDTRTYNLEEVGRYYRDRKEYERAIVLYEECVRRAPAYARLRAQLGTLYSLQADVGRAEEQYRQALRLDPDTELALQMLAEIELARGDSKSALEHARRLVGVKPEPAVYWDLLGRAAEAAEAWGEAARAWSEFGRRAPSMEADRQLGFALLHANDPASAATYLRRALAAGATDPGTSLALAWAIVQSASSGSEATRRRADLDEAERLLRALLRQSPGDAEATGLLEQLRALRGSAP